MLNNWQINIGMSISSAEEKWQDAKSAVDKKNYDDETYWKVVTSVFKKMMGESQTMETPTFKSFEQYLGETRESEYTANRHMGLTGIAPNVRHNAPYASINHKEEQRKQELHSAVAKHIANGKPQLAHNAAYKVAHAHALEDRHDPDAAHEIATRRAKYFVKKAQETMRR